MILKGSQRGNGQNLAAHLKRLDENEHVTLHEMRGFASDNLKDAFKEVEGISQGTKCSQYLFSLSLSAPPSESVSTALYEDAIGRIEESLGLTGQPRAIVAHEKHGRRHFHCVWSRIDADTMTARPLSFFKTKLMTISRELFLENGWSLPKGLTNAAERNPTNYTLAEYQQAKRQNIDPRWLKSTLQDCWQRSDSAPAFMRSLDEHGLFLAKGDRRDFVVLDHTGEVWSLPRLLGATTKDVRARLGTGENLPGVAQTKDTIGKRMTPAIRRHVEESRGRFAGRANELGGYKHEMTRLHRLQREQLHARQKTQWEAETRERAARLPKGLRGLWHRITGRYQEVRALNEREALRTQERQAGERQGLIDKQLAQSAVLQKQVAVLRREQA
ncbi:MAG: relaxase/mobilization nuclease domain-containing protein, partial [Mesorhizobium sp.]